MKICVYSTHGSRGEETPCAFYLGGHRLCVSAVLERWADSTHRFFEVGVDDGRRFVLRFEPSLRTWELAAVFGAAPKPQKPKPANPAAPRKFFFPLYSK